MCVQCTRSEGSRGKATGEDGTRGRPCWVAPRITKSGPWGGGDTGMRPVRRKGAKEG